MAISVVATVQVTRGSESVSASQTLVGEGWEERDVTVEDGVSNQ